jgi:hypothetical protein
MSDKVTITGAEYESLRAEVERLAAQLVEAEKYNGWHQQACLENERLTAALEEVRDSGLLRGPTVLHDKTLDTVHAALTQKTRT